MSRLYLVRHASHGLVGQILAGRMPGVHLGVEGHAQTLRLAQHFAERDVTAVLTSPLERCLETVRPIADRLALQALVDERLNEIDCGAWTGISFETLGSDPRWQAWNAERHRAAIPGGETMVDVQRRVMSLVAEFAAERREPAVLVTHGDVIKAVVATLLGSPLQWHDRIDIDPASITTVDLWPDGGKIVRMNEMPVP